MLYNKTTKQKITEKTRVSTSFFALFKGLMFEKKKNFDYAMVFVLPVASRTAASIHTFFVFFPIDVVFLDSQKKVIEVAKSVKPFTPIYMPKKPAAYFVELPEGKSEKISPGNIIEWKT